MEQMSMLMTAFRRAVQNDNLEECRSLLEHGADVHSNEDHVFRWAAENGRLEVCKLLLEYGADLKTVFETNGTPRKVVFRFATKEQIETARREREI